MIAALLWEGQETGGGRFGDKESRSGTLDDFLSLDSQNRQSTCRVVSLLSTNSSSLLAHLSYSE